MTNFKNQFYPKKLDALLRTILDRPVFSTYSDSEKFAIQQRLISNITKRIFSYNGPLFVKRWREEQAQESFIFYPLTAGDIPTLLLVTLQDDQPSVLFHVGATELDLSAFGTSVDVHNEEKTVFLKRKKKFFEDYDPIANPYEVIKKKFARYDLARGFIPSLTQHETGLEKTLGVEAYLRFKNSKRLVERRTLSYRQIKEILYAAGQETTVGPELDVIPSIRRFSNQLTTALQEDILDAFASGWDAFKSHLDQANLAYLKQAGMERTGLYGFVNKPANDRAAEFRANALRLFGRMGLAEILLRDRIEKTDADAEFESRKNKIIPFWSEIHKGVPPLDAIKLYKQDSAAWKRIAKLPVPPAKEQAEKMFDNSLFLRASVLLINLIPPASTNEWRALGDVYSSVSELFPSNDQPIDPNGVADFIQRTWKSINDRPTTWKKFSIYIRSYANTIREVQDLFRSMEKYVLTPVLARAGHSDELAKIFRQRVLARYNLHHLNAASEYWHSDRVRFRQRLGAFTIEKDQEWAPLITDVTSPEGIQFVCLTSRQQLAEEGDIMKHCVWSYVDECIHHGSHIISIRDRFGNRLSTLEISEMPDGKVQNKQHQAFKRAMPSPKTEKAASWLIEQINNGSIVPDYKQIRSFRAKVRNQQVSYDLGFDITDIQKCEDIFALYLPCIPPRVRERVHCVADFFREILFDEDLRNAGIDFSCPDRPKAHSLIQRQNPVV